MIRSLYRWKSFWLGALVLVFLGWSWHDSGKNVRGIAWSWGPGTLAIYANSLCGGINIAKDNAVLRKVGLTTWRQVPPTQLIQSSFPGVSRDRSVNGVSLHLPYWCLVLLFAIPWTAFIAWRWRRMRRFGR